MEAKFERKLHSEVTKKPLPRTISEPVPGDNHKRCAVCKNVFSDYLAHVNSWEHAEKCRL